MAKKKKSNIENLCTNEDTEICFVDNPKITGEEISSFNFDDNMSPEEDTPKVITPVPTATFKRSYYLTKDTIRKVDELKAKDPSLTTYVSRIVETAIQYYYDYIMNLNK